MLIKKHDLTSGSITRGLWSFALPLMLGNVLQQFYNLADTWVVGKYIGDNALAAVGSSYTLLTFLTSVVIGLSLGTGSFISMAFGRKQNDVIRSGIFMSATLIFAVTLVITGLFYALLDPIISALLVPDEITGDMHTYLAWVFVGFFATALYNYVSNLLRSMGNSMAPLIFLGVSVVLNVGLDLLFVIPLGWGIAGAAAATVIAQYASGIGILIFFLAACPEYRPRRSDMKWNGRHFRSILSLSGLTCLQQSVMNLGILMVQAVVNSFGPVVMAAFAVAVKIDTIAYMPVQDLGNAFSVFVAQNYGAERHDRIRSGIRQTIASNAVFCAAIKCAGVRFRRTSHEPVRGRFQRGNDSGGRAVPEDGGRVLHRHRHIVYAVRVLPRRQQAGDVRGSDCYLVGDESPACECAFTHTGNRCFRHMDSYSDRVVPG